MGKIIHEIHPDARCLQGKTRLLFCRACDTDTLHITPFFGYPFRCVANHGGLTKCDSCDTFVSEIEKITVTGRGAFRRLCGLCCEPDSPEKEKRIEARKQQAIADAKKPVDLNDPISVARAFGATAIS